MYYVIYLEKSVATIWFLLGWGVRKLFQILDFFPRDLQDRMTDRHYISCKLCHIVIFIPSWFQPNSPNFISSNQPPTLCNRKPWITWHFYVINALDVHFCLKALHSTQLEYKVNMENIIVEVKGPLWLWSYGNWIYNYLYNQC